MLSKGLLAKFEIQSEKNDTAESLLQSELPMVNEEHATCAWFAINFGRSAYVIMDISPDKDERELN